MFKILVYAIFINHLKERNLSHNCVKDLEKEWAKEALKKDPSLMAALIKASLPQFPLLLLLSVLGYGCRMLMPLVLSELIGISC